MIKIILLTVLLLIDISNLKGQSIDRSKRIGDYLYGNVTADTMNGHLFITLDSFIIIYQVKKDSDLLFPVYKGTWDLSWNMKDILFKFDNGYIEKGKFVIVHYGCDYLQLRIDNSVYTRNWP